MYYNNHVHVMDIVKVEDLPFPILLGRDAPAFTELPQAALPQVMAMTSDDEEPGPSQARDTQEPLDPSAWSQDDEFQRVQTADLTLTRTWSDLAVREGEMIDARRAGRLPQFEQKRGLLWCLAGPDRGGGEPRRHLVVPSRYTDLLLGQAYGHPWAGHQGCGRTLSQLLDSFFWPSITQDVQRFC